MNAIGRQIHELDTPFLWVDLEIMERNIQLLADFFSFVGVDWRPHTKGIKVPAIAHKAIEAGAIGVEFAHLYNTFGTNVTLIESMPNILPNEDYESLAQSILRLIHDFSLSRKLGEAGKQKVKGNEISKVIYKWETVLGLVNH